MSSIFSYEFSGKKILIRVDFNVPLDADFNVTDDTRLRAAIPTIQKILQEGAAVILMSHLGRPKGKKILKYSLRHIVDDLSTLLNLPVKFTNDCVGEEAKQLVKKLHPGEILLLENLRFYKEEEEGDVQFARKLASLGDAWINDAFGTAHRAHSSTSTIAQFFPEDKMFGYIMENELKNVDKILVNAKRPFTAILGGAKVSSKITILERLLDKVDNIIVGGGMTYTFVKVRGGNIGNSICEEEYLKFAKSLLKKAKEKNVKLFFAKDAIIADEFSAVANTKITKVNQIPDGWQGLDIGPETIPYFCDIIQNSATILWNGPVGVFELKKFASGTKSIAQAIVEATNKGAFSLIGGGDSVAAINQFNLADKVSYVSTGGGALLEYIEGKELPGIKAVKG